jgi:hypothetical protein
LVGWWVGGLVGWWVGGLVGWWLGGLVGWWVGGLVGRLAGGLVGWPTPTRPARSRKRLNKPKSKPKCKDARRGVEHSKAKKHRKNGNVPKKRVFGHKSGGKRVKVARPEGRLGHSGVTHLLPTGSKAALSCDLWKVSGVRFFGQKLSKKQGFGRSRYMVFFSLYGGLGFGLGSRLTKQSSAIDCLPSRLVDRPEICS